MKLPRHTRAFTILEAVVYLAVSFVFLGAAAKTFSACWDKSISLRRNADDVARALDVGERWRADLRAATAMQLTETNGGQILQLDLPSAEITYTFARSEIRRQSSTNAAALLWLAGVKNSRMIAEPRDGAPAWRWEIELKSIHNEPRLKPLFTFEAVAGKKASP